SKTPKMICAATSNTVSDNQDEDIQTLLRLEAVRRSAEDARNVHKQVEEQARLWLEAKCDYQREYARLASLTKCIGLRVALDRKRPVDAPMLQQAAKDASDTAAKISGVQNAAALGAHVLEQCKEQLASKHQARTMLSRQQSNLAENHECLRTLQMAEEVLESGLELAIEQAMDQFVAQPLPRGDREG
ncbi:hypothetical protein KR018_009056, partial [Drosophila ironensis]